MTKFGLRAALLAGAATFALANGAFAQSDTVTDAPTKHRHRAASTANDRLDLLERQVRQQATQVKLQEEEIALLKAQLGHGAASGGAASAGGQPLQPEVTAAQFQSLQSQVQEQASATKRQTTVAFTPATRYLHQKAQPTISSADGKWTFSPIVLAQGDWADYSKGQPLSTPGTDNLKSSGENIRRAWIGFQGTFDGDFGYKFVYDFGGSNGDETYQGYGAANSGQTGNNGGKNITPYTTSTGQGTGPHVQSAYVSYKGILDPFTLKIGVLSTPSNLGDSTQSDDLLFSERASPSQISRGLDADEGRESAGFVGNGSIWNASLFLTGDTYGKGALVAPATTNGGSQEAVVGRVAIAPWQNPDTNFNVHLGANFGDVIHPQESTNTQDPGFTTYNISFSDRPELRVDNVTFLNTGSLDAKSAYSAGLEAAVSYGPFMIQGENFWYGITRNNPGSPPPGMTNPNFSGWYVEGSWVMTGEPRRYNMVNASFTRPSPAEPFDPSHGNWGAWELAARYSSTDLDHDLSSTVKYTYTEPGTGGNTLTVSNAVFGGVQNIWSAGVNFYPNDVLRFRLAWQNVELRNIGALNDNGHFETIDFGTQVTF
jgi:phosphate-selective porin OprO/OprP